MNYLIGTDTGGTFTDAVIVTDDGSIFTGKAFSTPNDFSEGVMDSAKAVFENNMEYDLTKAAAFLHGTTITTNAMVTRKGCKVGLLTTVGHRDSIFIMRISGRVAGLTEQEISNYPFTSKPKPIISKNLVEEIIERIDYKGRVLLDLNEEEARKSIQRLFDQKVDAIAVSLLWSFQNPKHEQRIKELIEEMAPNIYVSVSHEIVPKLGEYERGATTAINCYALPLFSNYVDNLEQKLRKDGLQGPILVMQSSGGVMTASEIRKIPVSTAASGPAGGIIACQYLGELLGHLNVIGTDVGGTTFDVGLVVNGRPLVTPTRVINQYKIYQPSIDVVSIGSGGGSIASVEGGFRLKVGPESAGSYPGPACFDHDGELPTVTDADLVLGYIDPDYFLGGKIQLNREKAERAIMEHVAKPLNLSLIEAASGIFEIVNAQMADLVRKVSVERGYDPRNFIVYAYGGAGPTHATSYAKGLGAQGVLIPASGLGPVFSAFGIATSDLMHVYEHSDPQIAPFDAEVILSLFARLREKAIEQLIGEGVKEEDILIDYILDMHYRSQINELSVSIDLKKIREHGSPYIIEEFEKMYEQHYGKGAGFGGAGIELVNFRISAKGKLLNKPTLQKYELRDEDAGGAIKGERLVFWKEYGDYVSTPIYQGEQLKPGNMVIGPAVIEEAATSIPIFPHQVAKVDEFGNLLIVFK